jgi:hypothetical protein
MTSPNHDTISLPGAAFNNNFVQLIAATTFNNTGAVITADANDTIKVPGLTQSLIAANPGSFSFHA